MKHGSKRMRIRRAYHASACTGKTHNLLDCIFEFKEGRPSVSFDKALEKVDETIFLSFSNAAVEELKARIYRYLQQCEGFSPGKLSVYPSPVKAYTIHSFALEVLRVFRFRIKFALPEELNLHMQEPTIWEQVVAEHARYDELVRDYYTVFKKYGNYLYFIKKLLPAYSAREIPVKIIDEKSRTLNARKIYEFFEKIVDMGDDYIERMFLISKFDPDVPVFFMLEILRRLKINEFFEELRGAYGWNIRRIIIDEAQDNDILQNLFMMVLIWKDCDEQGSLVPEVYIAGDHKQSIYMWRNAFPELYKDILEKVGKMKTTLATSFRIKNQQTLNKVNNITSKLADHLLNDVQRENFWFDPSEDKLRSRGNIQNKCDEPVLATISLSDKMKDRLEKRKEVQDETLRMLKELASEGGGTIGVLLRSRSLIPEYKGIIESAVKELKKINKKISCVVKMDMDIPLELISEAARDKDKKIVEYVSPFTLLCALAYEVYSLLREVDISIAHTENPVYSILKRSKSSHFLVKKLIDVFGLRKYKNKLNPEIVASSIRRFWQNNIQYYVTGFLRLFFLLRKLDVDANIEDFWRNGIIRSGGRSSVSLPVQEVIRPYNLPEEQLKRILRHLMYKAVRVFEDWKVHYTTDYFDRKSFTNYLVRVFYLPPLEAPSLLTENSNSKKYSPEIAIIYTTIHASKGKEYDGVLAVQTDDVDANERSCEWNMEVRWKQLSSPDIWKELAYLELNIRLDASGELNRRRRAIENFNLGYVAVTRTRKHLIFVSNLLER